MSAAVKKLERKYFGKIEEAIDTPNLIEVQLDSYKEFLQEEVVPGDRVPTGLQSVFQEVFRSRVMTRSSRSIFPSMKWASPS